MAKNDIPHLPARRAREFLNHLAEQPFIALVMSGENVRVYSKGLDERTMEMVARFIESLTDKSPERPEI